MTRFVCISDTHGIHEQIPPLPDGDVLIHAGDFTGWGTYSEIEKFASWLGDQPSLIKIVIAGNHDEEAQDTSRMKLLFGNFGITYLKDSFTWYDHFDENRPEDNRRFKIYGTPYTPEFCGWHFMEHEYALANRYNLIPEDTDILICHGPPRGILDESGVPNTRFSEGRPNRVGSTALATRIGQLPNLKLFVCGHIHAGRGVELRDGVYYVNAASLGENYEPVPDTAVVIDL